MPVLQPQEIQAADVDTMALQVFLKALELIGGPRRLVEYRNLTWLPSLMAAAYTVVLSNEAYKTEDEIAAFLGLTRNTVRNIRRADPELVRQKLKGEMSRKNLRAHMAGALAQWAYQEVKRQV